MIIKAGERLPWKIYSKRNSQVKALHMNEDFMFETRKGWVQGFKGQWLVELDEGLRCNLDDEAFQRSYKPVHFLRGAPR